MGDNETAADKAWEWARHCMADEKAPYPAPAIRAAVEASIEAAILKSEAATRDLITFAVSDKGHSHPPKAPEPAYTSYARVLEGEGEPPSASSPETQSELDEFPEWARPRMHLWWSAINGFSVSTRPLGSHYVYVREDVHDAERNEAWRRRVQSLENELGRMSANTVSAASMRTEFEPGTLEAGAPVVMGHDGWVEWHGKRFVFDREGMIDRLLKAEDALKALREITEGGMISQLEHSIRDAAGALDGETTMDAVARLRRRHGELLKLLDAPAASLDTARTRAQETAEALAREQSRASTLEEQHRKLRETAERVIRERDAHEVAEEACRAAIGAREDESTVAACERAKRDLDEWARRMTDASLIIAGGTPGRR